MTCEEMVITRVGHEAVVIVSLEDCQSLKESERMRLVWDESARNDYVWCQNQDRKVFRRIRISACCYHYAG